MGELFVTGNHWCRGCGRLQTTLFVLSRPGGFVTQGCLSCGTSNGVSFDELPALECGRCGASLVPFIADTKNYAYRCNHCQNVFEFYTILPNWSSCFGYSGFQIEEMTSDFARPVSGAYSLSASEILAFLKTLKR